MNFLSLLPIVYGLSAAIAWGAGDFAGGLAARRSNALAAVFHAEWIGLAAILGVTLLAGESPLSLRAGLMAFAAGAIGALALVVLYKAMAEGQMSVAAPISALLAASLPVMVESLLRGLPGLSTQIGFALALAAVWLIASGEGGRLLPELGSWRDLRLPFISGIGFGLYFILINQAGQEGTLWPLVISRTGGVLALLVYVWLTRASLRLARPVWPLAALNATLDVTANGFYVLASQVGRMDVAAVISSLYPGLTVLLAWLILKERIQRLQALGIALALTAIALIAL
ncbi:MAG: DMT family transporter [Anaerolineales bacterium]